MYIGEKKIWEDFWKMAKLAKKIFSVNNLCSNSYKVQKHFFKKMLEMIKTNLIVWKLNIKVIFFKI